jgi:hypothetical protein
MSNDDTGPIELYPDQVPTQPLPLPAPAPATLPVPQYQPLPAAALVAPGTIVNGYVWDGVQWVPLPSNREPVHLGRNLVGLAGDRYWVALPLAVLALGLLALLWSVQYGLLLTLWSLVIFLSIFWRWFFVGFMAQHYLGNSGPPGSGKSAAWIPWAVW